VDLVNSGVPSISHSGPAVVPLMTSIQDSGANEVMPITGPRDGTAATLTDDEVPYLGILNVLSNTGDARPTMDRLFIFGRRSHRSLKGKGPTLLIKRQYK
jgi:hypothetical protein